MVRIIPCLLLSNQGFYKTSQFGRPVYLGDPANVLRIFNEKEVDEIVVLDIVAGRQRCAPDYAFLEELASECFMPLAYGGGLSSVEDVKRLLAIGFEKAVISTAAAENPDLIRQASAEVGSQSVVVCIDAKRSSFGRYEVVTTGGTRKTSLRPEEWAIRVESDGAGEIIVQSVDRDGTMTGYDTTLVRRVSDVVSIPVIAVGGARVVQDFSKAVNEGGASACGAGAMFVFQGRHRAVLINVPTRADIERELGQSP